MLPASTRVVGESNQGVCAVIKFLAFAKNKRTEIKLKFRTSRAVEKFPTDEFFGTQSGMHLQ